MTVIKMKRCIFIIIAIILGQHVQAQYTVNGSASQDACNLYTLTPAQGNKTGSVWNNNKINLTQSFDFNFDVWLGSPQPGGTGADGIAFVLQPISTSVGSSGSGLGYQGISPAVGVTIDTYQNSSPDNDPFYDHIAIQLNGDLNHLTANNIAGPVTAINGNNDIEDNAWHSLRVQWNAATTTLTISVDGAVRVTTTRDLVNTVFGSNPLVYWGFTGSTGGEYNLQRFRTALNPSFHFSPAQKRCVNEPITFIDSTISFATIAKFYWDFGDGSPLDSVNLNPVHIYTTGGPFTVIQKVIGADGCVAINTQNIFIGTQPVAGFFTDENCVNNTVHFTDTSKVTFGTINTWNWDLGNTVTAVIANPSTVYTTGGNKTVTLDVITAEGCEDLLTKTIHIFTKPVVDFTFTDSVCLGSPTSFTGAVISSSDPVSNWAWNIDGNVFTTQNTVYTFTAPGIHPVIFSATSNGSAGCAGSIQKNVFVVNKPIAYFKLNTICQAVSTAFTDSSYSTDGVAINQWWWNLGNSGFSALQNPAGTYAISGNDTIRLVVHNSKGCASDTLKQPIIIHAKPLANFSYSLPTCTALPVQFSDSSKVAGADVINKWSWVYNGTAWSTTQNSTNTFAAGTQTVKLVATSNAGCISDSVPKTFYVNPSPSVSINFKDACKNALVNFTAVDNSATVTQWKWTFGDGASALTQNAQHAYSANGTYKVKLFATASNGCYSDSLTGDIKIYSTNVFAGNDTIAAAGQPVQLNATGGLSYTWTPALPLSDPNIANPVATLTATQTFTVKAFTPEGCESFDDITVKIYKGPDIYLPNAFTPNGDGLNDVFRGTPVGIKQFNYLKIFNRWGQEIFSTTDYRKGWDGNWQAKKQNSGVFVVIVSGVDFLGNIINKKQSFLLIR
jgi:gliding motility-associated-like protein